MKLTDAQRATLRLQIAQAQSRRRSEVLRQTTHSPTVTRELERETSGPDPWTTYAAPGRSADDALNLSPLVTRVRT